MNVQVDLTWHGHHHSYQRTCPVYKGECVGLDDDGVARAPVHMVIGHAGANISFNVEQRPSRIWQVRSKSVEIGLYHGEPSQSSVCLWSDMHYTLHAIYASHNSPQLHATTYPNCLHMST